MEGSKDGRERRGRQQHRRRALMLQPTRQRIGRLLVSGREEEADEVAAELKKPLATIVYHLRELFRHGVLEAVPRGQPGPRRYRWSPEAEWARKLLEKSDD